MQHPLCACGKIALARSTQCLDCYRQSHTIRCTAETPWDGTLPAGFRVEHAEVESLDDRDYGGGCYCAVYRCKVCGHRFEVELPQ